MKRILALLMAVFAVLTTVSCTPADSSATRTQTEETSEEVSSEEAPVSTSDDEKYVGYDPIVGAKLPELLAAIPIANSSMSEEELRNICVDFFRLQLSFKWLPDQDYTYVTSSKNERITYEEGKLQGGIPYINTASGNLYRILHFYDAEHGVLRLKELTRNNLYFGNACSGSALWAWSRVINTVPKGNWTHSMTHVNGFLRLGNYTYSDTITNFGQNGAIDVDDIMRNHTAQTMYECYALVKKADGIVSTGHVRMAAENANVVRREDGSIDPQLSTLTCLDQVLYTTAEHHKKDQDGLPYIIQGGVDVVYTFAELRNTNYIPFTFAEFLGTDPVEPGTATMQNPPAEFNYFHVSTQIVEANYPISDIYCVVKDAEGNVKLNHMWMARNHYVRSVEMSKSGVLPTYGVLRQYEEAGGHTFEVYCQLGNGERILVYTAPIVGR
ncbi:MAG: hypothetical protein IKD31_03120 [Clostridia bacterium]|nr:hypothetical protein [Clostridia bacterium]